MPQDRKTGAAWDTTADFNRALALGGIGMAWQFLRRNQHYRDDFARFGEKDFAVQQLGSGALFYERDNANAAAQAWGLQLFVDPNTEVCDAPLFWRPELVTQLAYCTARPAEGATDSLSLAAFGSHVKVLRTSMFEQVLLAGGSRTAQLVVHSGTLVAGPFALTFWHEGLATAARHAATLQRLSQLVRGAARAADPAVYGNYKDNLLALDGHLQGASYRDIAEQIYGPDRVSAHWTDDTRWMKSKVRRAVERGLALMNGGYRELL